MKQRLKAVSRVRKHWIFKTVVAVVVGFAIFTLGVNVGDGRININNYPSQNSSLPSSLDFSSVNQVYTLLKNNYYEKLTTSQLINGLNSGLAQATGDPYTEYFTPSQAQQFNNDLTETFSGIGAEIGQNAQGDIIIVSPIAGFPAAKAGLLPQDVIVSINGQSTTGMSIDEAVNAIRGPQNSKVTLDIVRGGNQQLSLTITRSNITVPSVTTSVLSGNIGYMQISQFTNDTATLAQQGAQQFSNDHVKGVILDLRDNPGGLLDAAISVSSLWVPQGKTVLQEKRGNTVVQTYTASGNAILGGIPTVVLINGGSASASEITAGALHDNKEAELVGTKSYGKGVVQQVFNLNGGAEIKITIASWFRPNGQNINKIGITPDQVVNIPSNAPSGSDPQKTAAINWINQR